MIKKNLTIDLDRQQMRSEITVPVKQGDDQSREIIITLRSSGVAWDVPQSATLRLRLLKPDHTAVYDDLPKSTDGKVHITLGGQMLTASGTARADIEITDGGAMLSSFLFYLDVQDQAIPDGTVESSSEFGALQSLISSAESAIESCESAAEGVTEAKEEAHTNALAAATAATLANQKAQDAEDAAGNAQTQANAAQSGAAAANSAASSANTAADRANKAAEAVEGLDVSQLVPEIEQFWRYENGANYIDMFAASFGGLVCYYCIISAPDGLSGSITADDGELTDVRGLGKKFLPAVTLDGTPATPDNFNATFYVMAGASHDISISLSFLYQLGIDITGIEIKANGNDTSFTISPGVIFLGMCKNQEE